MTSETPIHTVILAAGQGSRMRPLTAERPKALLPVGDETVLSRLLRQVVPHCPDERTLVVAGFRQERVAAELRSRRVGRVRLIENCRFLHDTNVLSLTLALRHFDGPFLVIEADAIFSDEAVAALYAPHLVGHSVWYAQGAFRPPQYGGIVASASASDASVADLRIVPTWEPRYAEHRKLVGVLRVGQGEHRRFRELLASACLESTRQYYLAPWIRRLAELPCRAEELAPGSVTTFNTPVEYAAALGVPVDSLLPDTQEAASC